MRYPVKRRNHPLHPENLYEPLFGWMYRRLPYPVYEWLDEIVWRRVGLRLIALWRVTLCPRGYHSTGYVKEPGLTLPLYLNALFGLSLPTPEHRIVGYCLTCGTLTDRADAIIRREAAAFRTETLA